MKYRGSAGNFQLGSNFVICRRSQCCCNFALEYCCNCTKWLQQLADYLTNVMLPTIHSISLPHSASLYVYIRAHIYRHASATL